MNIALWALQILLALHTLVGALWKLSSSEEAVPSLAALPHAVWLGLAGLEVICAAGLLLPAFGARFRAVAPVAALVIAGEMLLFCVVHLFSGVAEHGELVYWLVVAGLSGLVAFGRMRTSRSAAA